MIIDVPSAFAQSNTVQVRTGSHEKYSRLVFDWPEETGYDISKDGSTLTIIFKKEANLDVREATANPVRNITIAEVINQNPVTIKLTIPEDSRYRAFNAGTKIVLDVYNSPSDKAPPKTAEVTPAPEAKEEPKEEIAVLEEITTETGEEETIPEGEQKTAAEVPEVEALPLDPTEVARISGATLIAISALNSIGMAVFERGDQLWIVNDKPQSPLEPQVSGPNTKDLTPFEEMTFDNGKAFITKVLPGAQIRTEGGGLKWKVVVSGQQSRTQPIDPKREKVNEDQARSGKIIWPFEEPGQIIDIIDPITGRPLKVITAKNSKDYAGPARSFVDFDVLPAYSGLVLAPKVDDLEVRIISRGIEISRPEGLSVLSEGRIEQNTPRQNSASASKSKEPGPRIFDFKNWELGGIDALKDNQTIILSEINNLPKNAQDEDLMTLAKTALSNAMGAEALGFLEIIQDNNKDIVNTPGFRAIRGAARTIDYKTEAAFRDLSVKDLDKFDEIGYWRAYALADLGDWQQAIQTLPSDIDILRDYPVFLQTRVGLVSAEIALRGGNTDQATQILALVELNNKHMTKEQEAALAYLKGEAARQNGIIEETKKYWEPLTTGPDDLYRAKAGLALTRLLVDQKELTTGKAIDNLERLRYAWRGDELEAQINYWLGRTYFEARQFVKGLNIMREAASVAAGTKLGERVTGEMGDVFVELFLGETLDKITPLQAMALYEQFTELVPPGEQGDKIVERLADRLTQADILDKASELLTYQLAHRLDGLNAYNVGIKLAAVNLIDNKPDEAMAALNVAQEKLTQLPEEAQTQERKQSVALLRSRAYSRQGRPDQGIALLETLEPNPTINRLRADIAWTAGYWDDAAQALEDVIIDENMSLTRPLSDEHSALLLQRAVALNLAGDRIGLANMREKYADAMAQTPKARLFDVITRPRQSSALADRDTLMGIVSEVDLFSEFLNSYKDVSLSTSN